MYKNFEDFPVSFLLDLIIHVKNYVDTMKKHVNDRNVKTNGWIRQNNTFLDPEETISL